MSSRSPDDSPATVRNDMIESAAREIELRSAMRREDLWLMINTTLLAMLLGMVAFFGRDLYSDVKGITVQLAAISAHLATLTERVSGSTDRVADLKAHMNNLDDKLDKLAVETESNGRSLAEIKGFLQARSSSPAKENSAESGASHR